MYQCRFILGIKYTALISDVDNKGGYACVTAGDMWKISGPPS